MSKVVAFFDFDGTLTKGDSLIPFLRMVRGTPRFMLDTLAVSPYLVGYVLRGMRNDVVKEALLRQSLSGIQISVLRDIGKRFAKHSIPDMLRKDILDQLRDHQTQGHCCVLVSASLDIYLEPWAKAVGFDYCIASSLDADVDGMITGKLEDGNCYGKDKVRRIQLLLKKIGKPDMTYGYGNSRGDLPMLSFVNKAYLVKRRGVSPQTSSAFNRRKNK
jgi:phosphatidylglycerophosphatase C